MSGTKVVVIASGGMDSATLCYSLKEQGCDLALVTFDYGQRHRAKEIAAAHSIHHLVQARSHAVIDLTSVGRLMTGNALTGDVAVPDGHYEAESMRVTVVPNRNAIMLSIAFGLAADWGATAVATAVHGGDHHIYPDCRPVFISQFAAMEATALDGVAHVGLLTPFLYWSKADIARHGADLGVPFEWTWSCYKGGEVHCGSCGTCVERRQAFALAGVTDPTIYAITEVAP